MLSWQWLAKEIFLTVRQWFWLLHISESSKKNNLWAGLSFKVIKSILLRVEDTWLLYCSEASHLMAKYKIVMNHTVWGFSDFSVLLSHLGSLWKGRFRFSLPGMHPESLVFNKQLHWHFRCPSADHTWSSKSVVLQKVFQTYGISILWELLGDANAQRPCQKPPVSEHLKVEAEPFVC